MSYKVHQGDIFGRVGEGLGKGLAEQLPKEVEHSRLKKGLQELQRDAPNLDPMQFATQAYGTYGLTPQMAQSLGELARSKQITESLRKDSQKEPQANPFKDLSSPQGESSTKEPSLTTRAPIEATLKNALSPNLEDIHSLAGQLIEKRPDYYAARPEQAVQDATQAYALERQRNEDLQTRRENEQGIQNRIESGLREQAKDLLNAKVPGNVYSDIEDKAIRSVLPKSEGGEGLTEQEAKKKYGQEIDSVSRNYEKIRTIGNRNVLTKTPSENKRALEEIRKDFKKRDDLDNFAQSLITNQNISPSKAYYLAYKPSDVPALNNELVKLPELKKERVPYSTTRQVNPEVAKTKTYEHAPKLLEAMGTEGSPLAIYEELNSRGYDGDAWLDYVSQNTKKLSQLQTDQLKLPIGRIPTLDDAWLFYFSGLEKLMEQ